MSTSMTEEYFAMGRRLLGLERPPKEARHFMPPVVAEFETTRGTVFAFEGYDEANCDRYIFAHAQGDCLRPDLPGSWASTT